MSLDGCANEFSRIDPGNRESIGRLTVAVQQRLRPFVCHAMRDHHAAEDVLQETLLTMIEQLGRLRRSENLWPWMYRIARSKVQDHFRDRRRRRQMRETLTPGLTAAPLPTAGPDALGTVLQDEALAQLGSALEQLSDRCRAVVYLRFHERMPYTQIAALLDATPGQVRSQVHRATRRLRASIPVSP
jgi:RNA polymerase sigma-70 factor (ECF subfamily)